VPGACCTQVLLQVELLNREHRQPLSDLLNVRILQVARLQRGTRQAVRHLLLVHSTTLSGVTVVVSPQAVGSSGNCSCQTRLLCFHCCQG